MVGYSGSFSRNACPLYQQLRRMIAVCFHKIWGPKVLFQPLLVSTHCCVVTSLDWHEGAIILSIAPQFPLIFSHLHARYVYLATWQFALASAKHPHHQGQRQQKWLNFLLLCTNLFFLAQLHTQLLSQLLALWLSSQSQDNCLPPSVQNCKS